NGLVPCRRGRHGRQAQEQQATDAGTADCPARKPGIKPADMAGKKQLHGDLSVFSGSIKKMLFRLAQRPAPAATLPATAQSAGYCVAPDHQWPQPRQMKY